MKPPHWVLAIVIVVFIAVISFLMYRAPPVELPVSPPESSFDVMTSGAGRFFDVMVMKDKVYKCEYVVVRYVSGISIVPRLQGNGQPYCGQWVEPK